MIQAVADRPGLWIFAPRELLLREAVEQLLCVLPDVRKLAGVVPQLGEDQRRQAGPTEHDHDAGDDDVREDVGDPGCEHASGASSDHAHDQSVDGGEADAEPSSREPLEVQRAESDGLQHEGRQSGSESRVQPVEDHAPIGALLDRRIDHGEGQTANDQ